MNTASRKNIFILSFTLLVVMPGYGMVMPIMPFYIEKLGAGGTELGWLMSTCLFINCSRSRSAWGLAKKLVTRVASTS